MIMKKYLFLAAVALTMAACSNDETESVNTGHAISFRTPAVTRATEMTTDKLTGIKVTALNESGESYFSGIEFTKVSGGTTFNSVTPYYWPDGTLNFYAWWPTDLTPNITGDTKSVTFTPNTTIAEQQDFIVATATGNKSDNETNGVALTFKHALSQIAVKAKNTNDNYVFKARKVRIAKVAPSGTCTFPTTAEVDATWSGQTDTISYFFSDLQNAVQLSTDAQSLTPENDGTAMLVPQQLAKYCKTTKTDGAYIAVLMDIDTKDGANVYPTTDGKYDWVAVPIDTKWEAGKKYTYTLVFGEGGGLKDPDDPTDGGDPIFGKPIHFTVTVSDWDTTSDDQTVEVKP